MNIVEMRPDLTLAFETLLRAICIAEPSFGTLRPERIVVVSGGAWGKNIASIRSLGECATNVTIDGQQRDVELCLRPMFFRRGETRSRLRILVHELLHLDVAHPHLLDENMRHSMQTQQDVDEKADALLENVLAKVPKRALAVLGFQGEGMMRSFLVRPIADTAHRSFDDDDVFQMPQQMCTEGQYRTGWW